MESKFLDEIISYFPRIFSQIVLQVSYQKVMTANVSKIKVKANPLEKHNETLPAQSVLKFCELAQVLDKKWGSNDSLVLSLG